MHGIQFSDWALTYLEQKQKQPSNLRDILASSAHAHFRLFSSVIWHKTTSRSIVFSCCAAVKTDKKLQGTVITVWTACKILQKILRAFLIKYTDSFLSCAKSLYQYHTKHKQVKIKQVVIRFKLKKKLQSSPLSRTIRFHTILARSCQKNSQVDFPLTSHLVSSSGQSLVAGWFYHYCNRVKGFF